MRSVKESTSAFEEWLGRRTQVAAPLFAKLLKRKHEKKMKGGPFSFLRATFYRWVEQWPKVCPALAAREEDLLLAVGDLHLENFGTWRNSRDRLVWGMNDFDEACVLAFTSDLVRLTASALLAAQEPGSPLVGAPAKFAEQFLRGYAACLEARGGTILLDGSGSPLPFALPAGAPEDADVFWQEKLDSKDAPAMEEGELDIQVRALLRAAFPPQAKLKFFRQEKPGGSGSLGRARYTALVEGTRDAREIKQLLPSSLYWLTGPEALPSQTASLLQRAIRDPDPCLLIQDQWLLRQFAPDAIKIDLAQLPVDGREQQEASLLEAMGWETANIHLGSRSPRALQEALAALSRDLGGDWLHRSAEAMKAAVIADQEEWLQS